MLSSYGMQVRFARLHCPSRLFDFGVQLLLAHIRPSLCRFPANAAAPIWPELAAMQSSHGASERFGAAAKNWARRENQDQFYRELGTMSAKHMHPKTGARGFCTQRMYNPGHTH